MRFSCKTLFDITATGVTGHYKSSRVPFKDLAGTDITNELTWNRSRNQQRNLETLTQLIGLRTQIAKLSLTIQLEQMWSFEFEVDAPYVFGPVENPTEMLLSDCAGVPMLINLENKTDLSPYLIVSGNAQNIWFSELN
jgi:hypothetical protein